jgi:hypothetical protein
VKTVPLKNMAPQGVNWYNFDNPVEITGEIEYE